MSSFSLFYLKNADDVAIKSIGQSIPLSHHVGRYGLGDSDKSPYESTTSINYQRLARVIAMKVSQCLGLPVAALPGVGLAIAVRDDEAGDGEVGYWRGESLGRS